ncbi:MAG: hypothetical protein RBU37_25630 [Myxococcota bacterium]|jgi:hypothetical protein|nr:hypothetical protein [Myxococcota bacterium]
MSKHRLASRRLACLLAGFSMFLFCLDAAAEEQSTSTGSFAARALHLGGGIDFSLTSETIAEQSSALSISLGLDGRLSYFLMDGLALSAIPSFRVNSGEQSTSLIVGASVGLSYYLDLGLLAPFARAQGGLLFGRASQDEEQSDLKGFLYGGGLGVAIPLFATVVELSADYQGTGLSVENAESSLDAQRHALLAGVAVHMVFY